MLIWLNHRATLIQIFPTTFANCTVLYMGSNNCRGYSSKWLHEFLVTLGFFNSKSDSSLFIRHSSRSTIAILVYIDDIIITRDSTKEVSAVIEAICAKFDSGRLGNLGFFLGIESTWTSTSLTSSSQDMHQTYFTSSVWTIVNPLPPLSF